MFEYRQKNNTTKGKLKIKKESRKMPRLPAKNVEA